MFSRFHHRSLKKTGDLVLLIFPTNLMLILQHRNRGFAEAVEKSRQFYNLTLSDEEAQSQTGVLTHIIEAGTT